jgi:hypothetical protein
MREGVAVGFARRFDKLGRYVARLRLEAGRGYNFAQTGHPAHLTVWGHPNKLLQSVVDISPVD